MARWGGLVGSVGSRDRVAAVAAVVVARGVVVAIAAVVWRGVVRAVTREGEERALETVVGVVGKAEEIAVRCGKLVY